MQQLAQDLSPPGQDRRPRHGGKQRPQTAPQLCPVLEVDNLEILQQDDSAEDDD